MMTQAGTAFAETGAPVETTTDPFDIFKSSIIQTNEKGLLEPGKGFQEALKYAKSFKDYEKNSLRYSDDEDDRTLWLLVDTILRYNEKPGQSLLQSMVAAFETKERRDKIIEQSPLSRRKNPTLPRYFLVGERIIFNPHTHRY